MPSAKAHKGIYCHLDEYQGVAPAGMGGTSAFVLWPGTLAQADPQRKGTRRPCRGQTQLADWYRMYCSNAPGKPVRGGLFIYWHLPILLIIP